MRTVDTSYLPSGISREAALSLRAPARKLAVIRAFAHGQTAPDSARFQLSTAPPASPSASAPEVTRERTLAELKAILMAIQSGSTDPAELTDLIFYARHPELVGVELSAGQTELLDEWNTISRFLVQPALDEVSQLSDAGQPAYRFADQQGTGDNAAGSATNRFDSIIDGAVRHFPGLPPAVLKGLLWQESGFNPAVINEYGYAGIAQFGRTEAREAGLRVGRAGTLSDERLDPVRAIPAAARLLQLKASRLAGLAFARYGQPVGTEYWKFTLAAYNGGEATVALAMGHAYRRGLAVARSHGMVGVEALSYARRYAAQWENLKQGGGGSPLALAVARYFPALAEPKYREIGNYPANVLARATAVP